MSNQTNPLEKTSSNSNDINSEIRRIDLLFSKFAAFYGHIWRSQFKDEAFLVFAKKEWREALTEFSDDVFDKAILSCREFYELPPTLPQMILCCRQIKRRVIHFVKQSEPSHAHYLLQANILKVGTMSIAASQSAIGGGYGSALAGGAAGAALGAMTHNTNAMIGGGIAGGLVGLAADSLVKDVNYTMITDIQISERMGKGVQVKEEHRASLRQGSSSSLNQVSTTTSEYQRYRTRVVSNADKVNLAFKDAEPALKSGLVKALVGIF